MSDDTDNPLEALLDQLAAATDGLEYPSESDAAVEPVRLRPPLPWDEARQRGEPVEAGDPNAFFDLLRDTDDAARWHALHQLLAGSLEGLTLHRAGEVEIRIWVVGTLPGRPDERIGIGTRAVET